MKVLGTLAMIDEGETDWKMLAIDTRDPLAEKLNDIDDINTHMPGFLAATVEWFKIYKMPDGELALCSERLKFTLSGAIAEIDKRLICDASSGRPLTPLYLYLGNLFVQSFYTTLYDALCDF